MQDAGPVEGFQIPIRPRQKAEEQRERKEVLRERADVDGNVQVLLMQDRDYRVKNGTQNPDQKARGQVAVQRVFPDHQHRSNNRDHD
jgi:hypothetical protein